MYTLPNNYAFIDGNNFYLSAKELGWKVGHKQLRTFLKEKYKVSIAYYFIGYIKDNEGLYKNLSRNGFTLIFKEVSRDENDKPKGNIDAELVLQAMIDIEKYNQAVIVTSDGDFSCFVKYLTTQGKFLKVLASSRHGCSKLLSKAAKTNIDFLNDLREKLEYKN
jgi:uncharacterized LabA/DUF88 family protein